ncbi:MAG: hypothetical protein R2909_11155 [Gemmatimonadales bacterium]
MAALATALALAACGASTGPTGGARLADFFTREVFGFPTLLTSATTDEREILVTGLLIAPGTSYLVTGELEERPDTLVVVIRGARRSESRAVAVQNYYGATIDGLARRSYRIRVLHVTQKVNQPEVWDTTLVYDRAVLVR